RTYRVYDLQGHLGAFRPASGTQTVGAFDSVEVRSSAVTGFGEPAEIYFHAGYDFWRAVDPVMDGYGFMHQNIPALFLQHAGRTSAVGRFAGERGAVSFLWNDGPLGLGPLPLLPLLLHQPFEIGHQRRQLGTLALRAPQQLLAAQKQDLAPALAFLAAGRAVP